MAELAELKREEYEPHAPVFFRPKRGVRDLHRAFLASRIESEEKHIALVHEADDGHVDGFLIASLVPAPPVYDPGGLTALVDDFTVEMPQLWAVVGRSLLDAAISEAEPRGAVQTVVVCGADDQPKRGMLVDAGHFVASEWFTKPFGDR
jgi:hypothetical protein